MATDSAASPDTRLATTTVAALIAFAANSVLCRLALLPTGPDGAGGSIDAGSFTALRILSGALVLVAVSLARRRHSTTDLGKIQSGKTEAVDTELLRIGPRDLRQGAALFVYMVGFSLAYISLGAGLGALVLFGAVQVTMLAGALLGGERFGMLGWTGFALALAGLVWLVSPGDAAPEPLAVASMAVAGIAWGYFSLSGRGAGEPVLAMTRAFVLCVPAGGIFLALYAAVAPLSITWPGALLAAASGGLASGLGYVLWYAVLPRLGAGRAATVQLAVPVIAAVAGVLLLAEPLTARLTLSSIAVLGGVALVLHARSRSP
ncbi:MAG: DMT family transporter [Pseudomonadota bacterium]